MSPKPYCHLYIDDAGLGVPLREVEGCDRLGVDWEKVGPMLARRVVHWNAGVSPIKDATRYSEGK
jgi:hypothetical protein